jgi:hypothetical protein
MGEAESEPLNSKFVFVIVENLVNSYNANYIEDDIDHLIGV